MRIMATSDLHVLMSKARRIWMNICLFFEGTGRGVTGKITNVTRLRDLCEQDARHFCRAWKAAEGGYACRWLVRCTSQPEANARASRWSRVR